jgi:hypothetical protein
LIQKCGFCLINLGNIIVELILEKMENRRKDSIERDKGVKKITRKEALKKAGYAAFSAATMMLLLNDPAKAIGNSPEATPDWNQDDWG